ncbi:protein kilB [Streptomyces sp. NPDC048644]|uniref:protein kilB n=1 Tax=Streptomyces sp. NPDC048644 TaxID=3365582 RepID=UPI00371E165A
MRNSLIAVLAPVVLGTASVHLLQQRRTRAERTAARRDEDTRQQLTIAVNDLINALGGHRMAVWQCESLRLLYGGPGPAWRDARARSNTTSAAITAPLATVTALDPALAAAAAEAAVAVYAIAGAADSEVLDTVREAATGAWMRFIAAADDYID